MQAPHISEDQVMEDVVHSSQDDTQPTQPRSQDANTGDAANAHIWGYLMPCNSSLFRIDFWRLQPTFYIGRNPGTGNISLPGLKISNKHCRLTWDGREDEHSNVTVTDSSTNGVFINGEIVGKGNTKILKEGNEIAFGSSRPQLANNGAEDYRYIFRQVFGNGPKTGLAAHYDLGAPLGKGSFATVIKAVLRRTGEWFAVKMIQRSKIGADRAKEAMFSREISILETLQHPNICQLKEVFLEEHNINLVLELVEGGDLLDHILHNNGIMESPAQDITFQLCDAMAYIHSQGVTHRDLKPENILLTKDQPPVVKVADFGLAKVIDSMTMLKTMCGTPTYLAPEVVLQSGNPTGYDNLVDSWSVGVIVFSMLTNSTPFIEPEGVDLTTRISRRRIDWTLLRSPDLNLSVACCKFVRLLLEDDPRRRMTLTAACDHPWLRRAKLQRRILTQQQQLEQEGSLGSSYETISHSDMLLDSDSYSEVLDDEDVDIEQSHDLAGLPANGTAMPLQRRSDVLAEASDLPEPSWEMLNNASPDAAPAEGYGTNKRKSHPIDSESSLTPTPDDDVMEGPSTMRSPRNANSTAARGAARKNGKGKAPAAATGRRTRAQARDEAITEDDEAENEAPSAATRAKKGRQSPQKAARRG